MRYTSSIDNVFSKKHSLTLQEAYVFSFLYTLPSWADKIIIGSDVYYFAARQKACEEIPLVTDKPDTMYRYYKALAKKGLVVFKKIDGKDYMCITNLGKKWGVKSEHSENNPNELGKSSESNSENNPTYKNTINNKNTKDKKDSLFLEWKDQFGALRSRKGVPEKRFNDLTLKQIDQLFIKTKEYLAFLEVAKWRPKKTAEAFLSKEFWNQDWEEQKKEHLKKEGKEQPQPQVKKQKYFQGRR